MKTIKDHVDEKLKEIAGKLQPAVNNDPADFYCGHTMGYKQALLDMTTFIEHHANKVIDARKRTTYVVYEEF